MIGFRLLKVHMVALREAFGIEHDRMMGLAHMQ